MSRGTYFRECPTCGCRLDPGEVCDCEDKAMQAEGAPDGQSKPDRLDAAVAS